MSGIMACVIAVMMYRGRFLKVIFETFYKDPRGFPYVVIITGKETALEQVYGPQFC